ncbi:MAG: radical SAM protein [Sphingobacteriales bacterium]|jgi:cyclic pyranopterin phosphate synthase|nr:MAG: radical SAM protein [Sphingobacteriales bacterium]
MITYTDPHYRTFTNLRLSLTDACNLNCVYCTLGNEDETMADHRPQQPASFFIDLIAKLQQQLKLESIRLTGGEPLLYRHLPQLIQGLQQLNIQDIKMTSNGFLLERQAQVLKLAGLAAINISLDAMDEGVFLEITKRKNLKRVLAGIDAALQCGLSVKLNAVIIKGINENQILPLLNFAFEKNIPIRFLEIMAMGHLYHNTHNHFFSQQQILNTIATQYQFEPIARKSSATANYWRTNEGHVFGIIANETTPFCHDCNRLRLDAKGNIYGCLSNNNPIFIDSNLPQYALAQKIQAAMQQKQVHKFAGSELSMLQIGG